MKITSIRLDRMRLVLDPPFDAAWDPVPRRHFDATAAGLTAEVASAGLRVGAAAGPADPRAREVLPAHGYDADHAVQQFDPAMSAAMTWSSRWTACTSGCCARSRRMPRLRRVRLLGSFDGSRGRRDVPDPAGGGRADYERVLGLLRAAMPGV